MSKKTIILGVLVLSVFALFGISEVSAYRGDYTVEGPNHTEEREVAMTKVMQEKDYNGWKTLMSEDGRTPGVLNKINSQEDFNKFAQAYELAHAGKIAEANAIRSELGLGNGQGRGGGNGGCNRTQ